MKRLSSYSNFFILLSAVMLLYSTGSYRHISTSLLSVLPESQGKELVRKFEEAEGTKTLLLAVKGFDDAALEKISRIESALDKIDFVEPKRFAPNSQLEKHHNLYRAYIDEINASKLDKIDISGELSKLYRTMTQSFFPIAIDRYDPLGIYTKKSAFPVELHNGHLSIGEYGYLSYFEISSRNLGEHTEVYRSIQSAISAFSPDDILLFSPVFYYVENAAAIKADVNRIVFISAALLILLYLYMLRNIRLLLNTIITLATSALFAISVVTLLYPEVSIFVVVFGVSISTVSIDYLFHHYFHGYYERKRAFNREVFYGFFTTAGAFFILSFTSFTLIAQISLFSLISLTLSYLIFAFLYPMIGFERTRSTGFVLPRARRQVPCRILFLFSLAVIVLSPLWLKIDNDIRKLDYQNRALQSKEHFYQTHLPQGEMVNILIEGDSIDQLIARSKKLKAAADFSHIPMSELVDRDTFRKRGRFVATLKGMNSEVSKVAAGLGFRKGYFDDAYVVEADMPQYTQADLEKYGIPLVVISGKVITYGTIDKGGLPLLESFPFVRPLSVKQLFEGSMQKSVDQLMLLGLCMVIFILAMLWMAARGSMLRALTYLVFPIAMVALYGIFVPLNILHLFMGFIVLSISIDYAIYTAKSVDADTRQAIAFSLMSTFAGFGVLVFSRIPALFSIGIVATLGITALFVLLIFLEGGDSVSDDTQ